MAALMDHPALREPHAGPAERRQETTVYFDTSDQALFRRGMSLRVRETAGRHVQTLKASGQDGVAADRGEWEWSIAGDQPDLDVLHATPAAAGLPRAPALRPVLRTEIDRLVRSLHLGPTVIEAALDRGCVIAGEAKQDVRELELELKQGSPAPVYRLALELHAAAPLRLATQSKAARGYRLAAGTAPEASKAREADLDRKTSGAEACARILLAALGHLLANQDAATSGDAEGVHQLRVAIRRLRAALVLFKPHLEPHATLRFEAELRRIGQVFGQARDWDVFCTEILPDALTQPALVGWRELLDAPAEARRRAAHARLVREIEAPAFTALVLGIAAWAEGGRAEPDLLGGGPALGDAIADLAPDLLDRLADKTARRGRHVGQRAEPQLHALRKSLKKLRYGIDYLADLYPHKTVKSYLDCCKDLQRVLGQINDTVAATALADQLAEGARPDLAPAIGGLAEHLRQRRQDARDSLGKSWKAFRSAPRFWN